MTERSAALRRYGVIGGMNDAVAADLVTRIGRLAQRESAELLIDRTPYPGGALNESLGRQFYLHDVLRRFERAKLAAAILPSFSGYAFLDALQAEVRVPVFNLFTAIREHLATEAPSASRIGILTSDFVRERQLFERYLGAESMQIVFPSEDSQRDIVMPVIAGLKVASQDGASAAAEDEAVAQLAEACRQLLGQGAEIIVPGTSGIAALAGALRAQGWPVIDVARAYAEHIVTQAPVPLKKPFKIGVVGGVGPAATVDLLNKIVVNTPAKRDQDHLKVVVEQNPQIPDRTEHLLGDGGDPTLAIYATCKRLQDDDASVIAIPCNTAHAFVARIQPFLSIPIVNMLHETMAYIGEHHPAQKGKIGLLATSGTIATRVYHEAAQTVGCNLIVPDEVHQQCVMAAIYGPLGVKAGYTKGECVAQLLRAMASLVARGAEVLVLGCTELPLIMKQNPAYPIAGKTVAIVDPTDILARKCVSLALEDAAR